MTAHGSRIRVDRGDHGHAGAVLADLTRLARVPAGRALLRRLATMADTITISKPPPLDPPNAWIVAETLAGPRAMRVYYDPRDWPSPAHPGGPDSDGLLFLQLSYVEQWLRDGRAPPRGDATLSWEPYSHERDSES